MNRGILATTVLAALLLTGCAAPSVDPGVDDVLVISTVDRSTIPGFIAEEQGEEDVTPGFDVSSFGVDPDSTRYQGVWAGDDYLPGFTGYDIYLGVAGDANVHVITVPVDDSDAWGSGSSFGNTVIGLGDPVSLQYLPQGTDVVPDGWHALSDWIIVKD